MMDKVSNKKNTIFRVLLKLSMRKKSLRNIIKADLSFRKMN